MSFLNNRYVIALVHENITARVMCSFCRNSQSCNLDDRYTTMGNHTRLTYFCNMVAIYAIVGSKKNWKKEHRRHPRYVING